MPATIQDVLKINIVLVGIGLLNNANETKAFSDAVNTEVITAGVGLSFGVPTLPPEPGRTLELQRDRISLQLIPGRTAIERAFVSEPEDLDRLADVVSLALKHTHLGREEVPTAFGYNIELVYDQTTGRSALGYLGAGLFGRGGLTVPDWKLVGGAGRFIFDSADGRWSIRVEPRFNDEESSRIYLSMNLHKAENRLPSLNEIRATFTDVWEKARIFVSLFDEGVSQ